MKTNNPLIVIIRDGWGHNPKTKKNFIKLSKTPNEDLYLKKYPNGLLKAGGEAVGLAKNYQGNSEVGHITIGAGRIILQSMTKINNSIKNKSFFKNKNLLKTIQHCKKNKTKLHLIGLLQTQGVHSHINHLFALLDLCKKNNFKDVFIHVITDGRDAPVNESLKHLKTLKRKIKTLGFGEIVTLSGRYYAMDRDKRWDRTKRAYNCIALGQAEEFTNEIKQIKNCFKLGETDEFIKPRKKINYKGFSKNDGVIFFNFRTDRPRQLTRAIIEKKFSKFKRKYVSVYFTAMTNYYNLIPAKVAFKSENQKNLLGEIISNTNLKQLRISETEKYAHVTFFFNGQKEEPYKNEDRVLIPSPKVKTYDLKPEMSVFKISNHLIKEAKKKIYDFILVNLVNCDMVGHTANASAIKKAVKAVDRAQGKIVKETLKIGYSCLLLADHGNVEDKSKKTSTSHTTNPVPVILISNKENLMKVRLKRKAELSDVAPTILEILEIKKPKEMTGKSFIYK